MIIQLEIKILIRIWKKARRKIIMSGRLPEHWMVRWLRSSPADVKRLIEQLRPVDCGVELVRIGPETDGGYLVPDDLSGIEYCFSPGVNTVSGFEEELASRGIRSFLADYSVERPPTLHPEFTFDKKFLGTVNNDVFMTLQAWKEKYLSGYTKDMILQMDIEGYEYPVLLDTPSNLLDQFRIIILEVHNLHNIFDYYAFQTISSFFEKLLERFHVVHIHPNNCCGSISNGALRVPSVMEFTLINKRRVKAVKPQRRFPHPLDVDNVPIKPPLKLPRCWYE